MSKKPAGPEVDAADVLRQMDEMFERSEASRKAGIPFVLSKEDREWVHGFLQLVIEDAEKRGLGRS